MAAYFSNVFVRVFMLIGMARFRRHSTFRICKGSKSK